MKDQINFPDGVATLRQQIAFLDEYTKKLAVNDFF